VSKKNPLAPYRVVTAGDLSGDVTSSVTSVFYQDNICYQCILTGAPVGRLYVQGSVDYKPPPAGSSENVPANAGNWINIIYADIAAADEVIFDINQLPVPYIRLFYDRSSGTGTMIADITAKEV
jgi:hypothetical protein